MLNDQELQQFIFKEVIQLVAMLGIDHVLFLGFQLVVEGKLGGRRRDSILQTGAYQNLRFDHLGEVDGIHVEKLPEDFGFPLVEGIVPTEEEPKPCIGILIEVFLPNPFIVAQHGVVGRALPELGIHGGTGNGQSASLSVAADIQLFRVCLAEHHNWFSEHVLENNNDVEEKQLGFVT